MSHMASGQGKGAGRTMSVVVTGAAGFIGYHVASALLERGETVIGLDNLSPYYDVALKRARLERLRQNPLFSFHEVDLADEGALAALAAALKDADRIVHLAAQAGVRYSLENPHAYVDANLRGHLNILELARHRPGLRHLVYASSSSVYGGNAKLPFAETDPVDHPVSLYAATKKADELMSHTYCHLFRFPATGLRFFTVYGPWGRPDMAYWSFTRAIFAGEAIRVFNHGDMKRDFTHIDDIVDGVIRVLDQPPPSAEQAEQAAPSSGAVSKAMPPAPHRVFNIGNNRAEPLLAFIKVIEKAVGRPARLDMAPMQPGDVKETYADIGAIRAAVGFSPKIGIETGIPRFVAWFKAYHGL